jgi:uncharacterized protein DUF4440
VSDKSANDFDNILGASERWMQAWQDQNRSALEQALAPDFALVVSTAPHYHFSRKDWINLAMSSYVCTRFAYEHVQFHRISSDIVVMSAVADQDAELGLEDRSGRFFVTDIWKRVGRTWKVCARYSAPPSEVERTVTYMVGSAEQE